MAYTPEEVGRQVVVAARSVQAADPGALGAAMVVLLEDDNWRSYIDPADLQPHSWQDFRLFVEKRLNTSVERLEVALNHSPRLAAEVRRLASAPAGHPKKEDPKRVNNTNRGVAYGMRRLIRERPDLAEKVDDGELTVHAACVDAGWRKPTATIPIDTAANAIKALSRRFTLQELRDGLEELQTLNDVLAPRGHVQAGHR
jgi:hypothetical protein